MQIEFLILISRRNKRGRFVKDLFLFLGVITFCYFFEDLNPLIFWFLRYREDVGYESSTT